MNTKMKRLISGLLIIGCALLFQPVACQASTDSSEEGASITLGLLAVVIGVLVIVGIISDVDYFTQSKTNEERVNNTQIDPAAWPGPQQARLDDSTPTVELAEDADLGLAIRF